MNQERTNTDTDNDALLHDEDARYQELDLDALGECDASCYDLDEYDY